MSVDYHSKLSGDEVLRHIVNIHTPPSEALLNHIKWVMLANRVTVELGLSTLSIFMARRSSEHSCVLPSELASERLKAVLEREAIETGKLVIRVSESATVEAIATGSVDAVILSCSPAFPAFFAHCHEALRMLRVGGRLIVRGVGMWTVEQFKNHLRIDPRFNGFAAVAPDAVMVMKTDETQAVEWFRQPYVVVNTTIIDNRALALVQAQPIRGEIENFSTTVARIQEARELRALTTPVPEVGLVGYYGFGNYGDELFRIAFEQGLPDVHLRMLNDLPRRPFIVGDRESRVRRVDGVIIGGGDLVIPQAREVYFSEEYLEKPVFIHGVGVPHSSGGADPKIVAHLKAFFQHPNVRWINARDTESKNWIEKHLTPSCPVDLSPDIVCGLDIPSRDRPPTEVRSIALVTRKSSPTSDFDALRRLVIAARARGIVVRAVIAGAGLIADNDYEDFVTRGLPVDEVVRCRTMEEVTAAITAADMVVSMKFHGCVVGLMAGLPTFSLLTGDKFINLYRSLNLQTMIMGYNDPRVAGILDIPHAEVDRARLHELRAGARAAMGRLRDALASVITQISEQRRSDRDPDAEFDHAVARDAEELGRGHGIAGQHQEDP